MEINKRKSPKRVEELSNSLWKPLYGFEELYLISNKGQIKSLTYYNSNRIVAPKYTKKNDAIISLTKEGICYRFKATDLFPLYSMETELLEGYFTNLKIVSSYQIKYKKNATESNSNNIDSNPIEEKKEIDYNEENNALDLINSLLEEQLDYKKTNQNLITELENERDLLYDINGHNAGVNVYNRIILKLQNLFPE